MYSKKRANLLTAIKNSGLAPVESQGCMCFFFFVVFFLSFFFFFLFYFFFFLNYYYSSIYCYAKHLLTICLAAYFLMADFSKVKESVYMRPENQNGTHMCFILVIPLFNFISIFS